MSKIETKIQRLCEDFGFDDSHELMESYISDSIAPAICMNDGCGYTTEYEPDQDKGWCEDCEEGTVCSIFILEGVI